MKDAKRKIEQRRVKAARGFKVRTNVRAGHRGSFNSRDSYGADYGTF